MWAWMPEHLFSQFIIKSNEFKNTISFQWSTHIPKLKISVLYNSLFCFSTNCFSERRVIFLAILDSWDYWGFCQIFGDGFCQSEWSSDEGLSLEFLSVFELSHYVGTVMIISGFSEFSRILFILSLISEKMRTLCWGSMLPFFKESWFFSFDKVSSKLWAFWDLMSCWLDGSFSFHWSNNIWKNIKVIQIHCWEIIFKSKIDLILWNISFVLLSIVFCLNYHTILYKLT